MFLLTLTVTLVVAVSAMCSLFEAVLYSVPASYVESLFRSGHASGKVLRRLREKVDEPITAILSLNTISNTGGAALAGMIAGGFLGSQGKFWFNALLTLLILFFAEVIPKTIGFIYSRSLAGWIARPLLALVVLFKPMVRLCGLITRLVAGKRESSHISGEELVMMAQLGIRRGVIAADEGAMIENILSLQKKTVGEVMTPRMVLYSLSGEVTVAEARSEEEIFTHSRIPIYFEDPEDISGIVHRRDILKAGSMETRLEEFMRPVHFVLEKTRLDRVLKRFLESGEHLLIALDEFGGVAGLITLEDVLEEILGQEIIDEFDRVPDMRQLAHERRQSILATQAQESSSDVV